MLEEVPQALCQAHHDGPASEFPTYMRRVPEDFVRRVLVFRVTNAGIVPYNAFLYLIFEAHINVEKSNSVHTSTKEEEEAAVAAFTGGLDVVFWWCPKYSENWVRFTNIGRLFWNTFLEYYLQLQVTLLATLTSPFENLSVNICTNVFFCILSNISELIYSYKCFVFDKVKSVPYLP